MDQPTGPTDLITLREQITESIARELLQLPPEKRGPLMYAATRLSAAQGIPEERTWAWFDPTFQRIRAEREKDRLELLKQRDAITTETCETWLRTRKQERGELRALSKVLPMLAEVDGRIQGNRIEEWIANWPELRREPSLALDRTVLDIILTFSESSYLPRMAPLLLNRLASTSRTIFADTALLLLLIIQRHPEVGNAIRPQFESLVRGRVCAVPKGVCSWHIWDAPTSLGALPSAFRALREGDPDRYAWCVSAAILSQLLLAKAAKGRDQDVERALWEAMEDAAFLVGAIAGEGLSAMVGWPPLYATAMREGFAPPILLRRLGRMGGGVTVCPALLGTVQDQLRADDPLTLAAAIEAIQQLALLSPVRLQFGEVSQLEVWSSGRGFLSAISSAACETLGDPRTMLDRPVARAVFSSVADEVLPSKGGGRPMPPMELAEVICLAKGTRQMLDKTLQLLQTATRRLHPSRVCRVFAYDHNPILLTYAVQRDSVTYEDRSLYEFLIETTYYLSLMGLNNTVVLHQAPLGLEKQSDGFWGFNENLLKIPLTITREAPPGYVLATQNMGRILERAYPFGNCLQDMRERQVTSSLITTLYNLYLPGKFGQPTKPFRAAGRI